VIKKQTIKPPTDPSVFKKTPHSLNRESTKARKYKKTTPIFSAIPPFRASAIKKQTIILNKMNRIFQDDHD
jgi:hypothetical protein